MCLIDQYPLPKVGQSVRLYNGAIARVVNVFRANAVLKMMGEMEAIALSANARARFGQNWRDVYYHLDIMFPSGVMDVVDTSKVIEIFYAS